MKGIHRIILQNKRVKYDFELRQNLTVIRGDSATGKTTLIEMIREHANNGASSSIELISDKPCLILEGTTWQGQLSVIKGSIVFIDEGNPFILTNEFASSIQQTDNYYVIVSRESLPNLPYSVDEIYGIRMSGKYAILNKYIMNCTIFMVHNFRKKKSDQNCLLPKTATRDISFLQVLLPIT